MLAIDVVIILPPALLRPFAYTSLSRPVNTLSPILARTGLLRTQTFGTGEEDRILCDVRCDQFSAGRSQAFLFDSVIRYQRTGCQPRSAAYACHRCDRCRKDLFSHEIGRAACRARVEQNV